MIRIRCKLVVLAFTVAIVFAGKMFFLWFMTSSFEDVSTALTKPEYGENVFFLETGESTVDVKLTPRQACAIESAALTNPHQKIFVLYSSRERLESLHKAAEFEAIRSYPNVFIYHLNMLELALGSPLEEFFRSKRLQRSEYRLEHTSDALRLLLLWKFGGTYLDMDMIVRKKLDSVQSNYACAKDDELINGAILNLDRNEGRLIASYFMDAFSMSFDGEDYAANGPVLITEVLESLCRTVNISKMTTMSDCEGFHVMKRKHCYAIPYTSWDVFMTEDYIDYAMASVEDSIVVHFWNNLSHDTPINKSSQAPYAQLARKHCPKVFRIKRDDFK